MQRQGAFKMFGKGDTADTEPKGFGKLLAELHDGIPPNLLSPKLLDPINDKFGDVCKQWVGQKLPTVHELCEQDPDLKTFINYWEELKPGGMWDRPDLRREGHDRFILFAPDNNAFMRQTALVYTISKEEWRRTLISHIAGLPAIKSHTNFEIPLTSVIRDKFSDGTAMQIEPVVACNGLLYKIKSMLQVSEPKTKQTPL